MKTKNHSPLSLPSVLSTEAQEIVGKDFSQSSQRHSKEERKSLNHLLSSVPPCRREMYLRNFFLCSLLTVLCYLLTAHCSLFPVHYYKNR